MKRSYNFQLVRSHRPYTIASLAKLLGVSPATVRRWIKVNGLDVAIVSETGPIILKGDKVKAWGKARQQARRQPCKPDEIYCVRCKSPQRIKPETFHTVQHNTVNLTAKGDCVTCGLRMGQFGSVANLSSLEVRFGKIA